MFLSQLINIALKKKKKKLFMVKIAYNKDEMFHAF